MIRREEKTSGGEKEAKEGKKGTTDNDGRTREEKKWGSKPAKVSVLDKTPAVTFSLLSSPYIRVDFPHEEKPLRELLKRPHRQLCPFIVANLHFHLQREGEGEGGRGRERERDAQIDRENREREEYTTRHR